VGLRVNDRASASGSPGAHAGSVLLRGPAEEAGARASGRVTVLAWLSGDARDGPDAWERAVLRLAGLPCGTTLSGRGRSVGRGERWWRLLGQREWFCGLSCRGKKGADPRWAMLGGKRATVLGSRGGKETRMRWFGLRLSLSRRWASAGKGRKTGLSWDEGFWAGLGFLFLFSWVFSSFYF
jgi:hypothetical protein